MASGWILWVWLECIGVVSGCCCKEVYIDILIIIITFPYSTCISSFLAAAFLLCSFKKCFLKGCFRDHPYTFRTCVRFINHLTNAIYACTCFMVRNVCIAVFTQPLILRSPVDSSCQLLQFALCFYD